MDKVSRGNISYRAAETMGRRKGEAAAGENPESGGIHQSYDGKEKEMQEKKLVELLHKLMNDICDHNCKKIDSKTQEEAEEICADCEAGEHICKILNENNRYSEIILCEECEYSVKDYDCQGTEFAWCRNDSGIRGNVKNSDGCSKGRRKDGKV